jgi:hypothetical protein
MSDEGRVLDGKDGQEGGSTGVRGQKERYWMRFLRGMVTDRNTTPSLEFCFHAKLTVGSETKFISPINESLIFCWVITDVLQPSGVIRGWVAVTLWVGSLNNGVGPSPEETEEERVVASSSSKVSGSCVETDLLDLDVPPIFQLFEDGLEVILRSSFA